MNRWPFDWNGTDIWRPVPTCGDPTADQLLRSLDICTTYRLPGRLVKRRLIRPFCIVTCEGTGMLRICCATAAPVLAELRLFEKRFCAGVIVFRYGPLTVPRTALPDDTELRNLNICLCVVLGRATVPGE